MVMFDLASGGHDLASAGQFSKWWEQVSKGWERLSRDGYDCKHKDVLSCGKHLVSW